MASFSFLLPGFQMTEIIEHERLLLISEREVNPTAECPRCHQNSSHMHSFYQRRPQDPPMSGKPVKLTLHVRRFRCLNATCPPKTFAERLPEVVAYAARRTIRFTNLLKVFAIHTAGEPGARLLAHTGAPISPDTLLRLAKVLPAPSFPIPTMLGVDDFAFRKGRSYGTLLIE